MTENSFLSTFFTNNTNQGYVFLFARDKVAKKAYKLGAGFNGKAAVQFFNVGITPQNWTEFKSIYQPWRTTFKIEIAFAHLKGLEAWYSSSRMGVSWLRGKESFVNIHLPKRSFKGISIYQVQQLIEKDKIIFLQNSASKTSLLNSWLANDWRKLNLWRANPLGYLERAARPTT